MSYLWNSDKEILKELKILSAREGRTIKEIIDEQVQDYIKKHKDGNPQHLMDNFLNNEDFVGFPSMGIDLDKKKLYAKGLTDKRLAQELFDHVCEWYGILQKK